MALRLRGELREMMRMVPVWGAERLVILRREGLEAVVE